MRQYFYNQETFEYTHFQDYPEDRAPTTGTSIAPKEKEGVHIVWDIENEQWRYLNPKEFTEHKIKLGLLTLSENQKVNEEGEIIEKTELELIQEGKISIDSIRQRKIAEVNMKAKQLIEGGFICNASGENYVYDTSLEDQFNIKSLLDLGLSQAEIRCRKEGESIKEFVIHTKKQIAKVVSDFAVYKMQILKQAHEMKLELLGMKDVLAVYNYEIKF